MELKIVCQCGQKFKFDVEPVNGQMPFTVNCPVCNVDGTATANAQLSEFFAQQPPPPITISAPPPPAPVTGRLRINRPAPASAPAPEDPAVESAAPTAIRPLRPALADATNHPAKKPNFAMGMLGGFIGAAVGVVIYFLIFKFTGLRFKLLAIGVGALAGWLAELFGKGEGSKELGGITAVFVLAGLIGAQYFVAMGSWHEARESELREEAALYDTSVTEAKAVLKAVPSGSEFEIRTYLARQAKEEGDKVLPAAIPTETVTEFRDVELPEYKALASGQVTREQFEQQYHLKTSMTEQEKTDEDNTLKGIFLLFLLNKVNLFSLAAAAGLAFKLSTNA